MQQTRNLEEVRKNNNARIVLIKILILIPEHVSKYKLQDKILNLSSKNVSYKTLKKIYKIEFGVLMQKQSITGIIQLNSSNTKMSILIDLLYKRIPQFP